MMELPIDGFCALTKIKGLEKFEDYFVDVRGEVWSTKYARLHKLSPGINRGRYLFVYLTDTEGAKKKFFVHQLVARAFLPEPAKNAEVNHINRNGMDNSVTNLEWCSKEENAFHCKRTKGAKLDEKVIEKARTLHAKLQREGIPMPGLYEFVNALLEGEIDRLLFKK